MLSTCDSARGKAFPLHMCKELDDTQVQITGKTKLPLLVPVGASHLLGAVQGPLPPDIRPTPKSPLSATTLSIAHRHSGKRLARQAGSVRQNRLRQKPPRERRRGGSTGVGKGQRHRVQDRSSFFCVTASLSCSLRFLQSR